ncbi:glycosyltransferase [Spirosoma sp. HMF3257]|uniref:Glycosyltransferase 2-like domain-containing protein n=1 Tax=Spirosoma telluris TaxID=2183553 RepID=A0A327NK02_9BACT|nr:glycosyltransferase [Spirosoma telluris]RAI74719.1 hypothetical protein HMF3257_11430 [Spirosoma telluris]
MITKKETVAVCIPTYNQAGYLQQAVESVLNQTHLPDEIWISDDASTDDTEKVGLKLAKEYPIIKYIRQKSNLGMGGNPNWLMRQPQTDFVAKLDSDDFYNPGYLEELVNLMKKNPQAGYAHCNVNQVNEKSVIGRQRLLNRKQEYVDGAASLKGLVMGYRVAANIILFRRIAIESVNFWDPNLAFADDWDLAVRLADQGWGNCFSPNILANYRVWSGVGNIRQKRKLDEIKG